MDPNLAAQPKVTNLPASKEAHLEMMFTYMNQLMKCATVYTDIYEQETPPALLSFIKDICMLLPESVDSLTQARERILHQMLATTREDPLTIFECINSAAPMPEPAVLLKNQTEDRLIPQVHMHASNLIPGRNQPYTLLCRQGGPQLLDVPYTVTFTPDPSIPGAAQIPVRSIAIPLVSNDGATLSVAPSATTKANPENVAPHIRTRVGSSSSGYRPGSPSNAIPSTSNQRSPNLSSATIASKVARMGSAFGRSENEDTEKDKVIAWQKETHEMDSNLTVSEMSASTIPFPSSAPGPVRPISQKYPLLYRQIRGTRDTQSVYSQNDIPPRPFNHFNPIPSASNGGSNGLKRTHAFCHKTHPEIFWNEPKWGDQPAEDQVVTIAECLPPWHVEQMARASAASASTPTNGISATQRDAVIVINDSANESEGYENATNPQKLKKGKARSKHNSAAVPSSTSPADDASELPLSVSSTIGIMITSAKGKKRAIEGETSNSIVIRRSHRLATPVAESVTEGVQPNARASERFSGLRDAVRNFTGAVTGKRKAVVPSSEIIPTAALAESSKSSKRRRSDDDGEEERSGDAVWSAKRRRGGKASRSKA